MSCMQNEFYRVVSTYMTYACTALIALNKIQRYRLEVIQNRYLCYAKSAVVSNSQPQKQRDGNITLF